MERYLVTLNHCTRDMAERIGGKALGLGELLRAGLPVPAGFVVTTQAYRHSVGRIEKEIESILKHTGTPDADRRASEQIEALFTDDLLPPEIGAEIDLAYQELCVNETQIPVAVRSSATTEDTDLASFAGQQETYLWIYGDSAIRYQIVRCWASLFTQRAISYRARNDIPSSDLAMGVVVQQMVPAESAGVMMTIDPVTGDRSQIYVESAFGLGEIVVRGEVEPDRFRIEKKHLTVQFEDIACKKQAYQFLSENEGVQRIDVPLDEQCNRSLSGGEVVELARLGREIERIFGKPMDIEWAVATNFVTRSRDFFMLQARPETVWSNRAAEESPQDVVGRQDDWDPLQGVSQPDESWTTSNVGENAPGVQTPLSWTIWWPVCEEALLESAFRIGAISATERKTPRSFQFQNFYGRMAMKVEHYAMLGDRMPGTTGRSIVEGIFGYVPEGMEFYPIRRRYPMVLWRLSYLFLTIPRKLRKVGDEYTAWWKRSLHQISSLEHHETRELFVHAKSRLIEATTLQTVAVMSTVQPMFSFIERLAARTGISKVKELGTVSGNTEMALVCDLWRVSRGEMTIGRLVDTYGFHGPAEGELSSRVWREDDTPLRRMAEQYADRDDEFDPVVREAEHEREREAVESEVLGAAPWWKRPPLRMMLKLIRRYLPLRGVAKCSFLQAFDVMRASARRIGEHLVSEGRLDKVEDVFYLTFNEIMLEFPENAKELVALRCARRAAYMKLKIPGHWTGMPEAVVVDTKSTDLPAEKKLKGIGVSRGVTEGRARVLMTPDFSGVESGEILVAPTTDPSWSSIMFISSGLVVDIGGALSHAAVVAREIDIPCVVNTRTGTTAIRTGDLLRVNGTSGIVEVLERHSISHT